MTENESTTELHATDEEMSRVLALIHNRVGPLTQAENRAAFAELRAEALERQLAELTEPPAVPSVASLLAAPAAQDNGAPT